MTPSIVAYTDGGCRGNPGPGGWGFVLIDPHGNAFERAGGLPHTTNNQMELTAAIEALSTIKRASTRVVLHTDSLYVLKSATQWLPGWKARGWRRKEGPLLNVPLLQELDRLIAQHDVEWRWVRGHSGDAGNEHVDGLANEAMDRLARGQPVAHERRFRWPTIG